MGKLARKHLRSAELEERRREDREVLERLEKFRRLRARLRRSTKCRR